jgi:putative flippase GtrA
VVPVAPKWAARGRYPGPVSFGVVRSVAEAVVDRRKVALRYVLVSLLNVANHQVLLAIANSGWEWSGGRANVFAAVVAAVPAYLLSRYWVWEARGSHSLRAEILPFWIIALIGLVLSTLLAEVADRVFGSGLPVALASIAGYTVVWVMKFLILEKLFTRRLTLRYQAREQPEVPVR